MTTGVQGYGVTQPLDSKATQAATDQSKLSGNYTMFLQLLTTQLKNQDPTQPMDANQFTQQLVQYSQVEQQIKTNSTLSTISSSLAIANATSMLTYVGQTVTADGSKTALQNSNAQWSFSLDRAASATINVLDSGGNVVFTQTGSYPQGTSSFTWNGTETNGVKAPDGTYTIAVSATDSSGSAAKATTTVTGVVSSIDFSSGQPYLTVGGAKVSVWSVSKVGA